MLSRTSSPSELIEMQELESFIPLNLDQSKIAPALRPFVKILLSVVYNIDPALRFRTESTKVSVVDPKTGIQELALSLS